MAYGGGATAKYASAPWARGLCDRCGFNRLLTELHTEIYDQRPNGLRVCAECLDKDHPQLQLGRIRINDPISLLNPRPDIDKQTSTTYFGWQPIGNPITGTITCSLGTLTVETT